MKGLVAMLRGVNVAGSNRIKMDRLRELFSKCGYINVRTFIQSGNVVFDAKSAASTCAATIERTLAREFGKPIGVLVRTSGDLAAVISANPFAKDAKVDHARLAVAFLGEPPPKDKLKLLAAIDSGKDRFEVRGKELYLHCPDGFARSKLAATFDKVLSLKATSRNWNTVRKLYDLSTM